MKIETSETNVISGTINNNKVIINNKEYKLSYSTNYWKGECYMNDIKIIGNLECCELNQNVYCGYPNKTIVKGYITNDNTFTILTYIMPEKKSMASIQFHTGNSKV